MCQYWQLTWLERHPCGYSRSHAALDYSYRYGSSSALQYFLHPPNYVHLDGWICALKRHKGTAFRIYVVICGTWAELILAMWQVSDNTVVLISPSPRSNHGSSFSKNATLDHDRLLRRYLIVKISNRNVDITTISSTPAMSCSLRVRFLKQVCVWGTA